MSYVVCIAMCKQAEQTVNAIDTSCKFFALRIFFYAERDHRMIKMFYCSLVWK